MQGACRGQLWTETVHGANGVEPIDETTHYSRYDMTGLNFFEFVIRLLWRGGITDTGKGEVMGVGGWGGGEWGFGGRGVEAGCGWGEGGTRGMEKGMGTEGDG